MAKKKLSVDQEFEIFKLVLDKFLWIGFAVMLYGAWQLAVNLMITEGLVFMIAGFVLLVLFVRMLHGNYIIRK